MHFVKQNINFNRNERESKIKPHAQFKGDDPCISAHIRIAN